MKLVPIGSDTRVLLIGRRECRPEQAADYDERLVQYLVKHDVEPDIAQAYITGLSELQIENLISSKLFQIEAAEA